MAEPTQNERTQGAAGLAAAARDRGMEQLEGAKGQLAEGAERVAAAVERTADELDGDGDGALSGFGHSVASLMRQLAGGLRERDVEEFARELADLARRNPGVFLAGSVALGFGIARFFKARAPRTAERGDSGWHDSGDWRSSPERNRREDFDRREDYDGDESLDLSGATRAADTDENAAGDSSSQTQTDAAADSRYAAVDAGASSTSSNANATEPAQDDEPNQAKARSAGKQTKRGGKS